MANDVLLTGFNVSDMIDGSNKTKKKLNKLYCQMIEDATDETRTSNQFELLQDSLKGLSNAKTQAEFVANAKMAERQLEALGIDLTKPVSPILLGLAQKPANNYRSKKQAKPKQTKPVTN